MQATSFISDGAATLKPVGIESLASNDTLKGMYIAFDEVDTLLISPPPHQYMESGAGPDLPSKGRNLGFESLNLYRSVMTLINSNW